MAIVMIKNKHINKIIILCTIIVLALTVGMIYIGNKDSDSKNSGISMAYESKLFDHDNIMSVDIRVDEDTWNSMLENASNEEYIPCDVIINGVTYTNVAIRPKGNTSLSQIVSDDTTDRFSFKIEFDHYDSNKSCYGLDKLVLNNVMSDTSYMKEYLSYDILNYTGVVTPLYNYASIKVNGEDWGFYLALEGMEESFAMRNYGASYGELYKPETMGVGGGAGGQKEMNDVGKQAMNNIETAIENGERPGAADNKATMEMKDTFTGKQMGGMGSTGGADLVYIDDDVDSYSTIFDAAVFKPKNSDYKRVIEAIKNLNEGTNLEKYIDVDAVLRYIAANTVVVNLDSYFSSMTHNYYLYESDGQITMLPWDYNLSFAGFQSGTATAAVNFPIDTPVSGIELSERPIIAKLLENEEYLARYHQYLQDIVTGYFDSGLYEQTINTIDARISSYVENDPSAFYTFDEYKAGVENITEFGLLRAQSIQGQLDGTIPSTTAGQQEDATALIDANSVDLTAMGTQGGNGDMGKGGQQTMGQGGPQMPSGDQGENTEGTTGKMTPPQMPSGNMGGDAEGTTDKMTPPQMPNGNMGGNTEGTIANTLSEKDKIIYIGCGVALVFALGFVLFYQRRKYRV